MTLREDVLTARTMTGAARMDLLIGLAALETTWDELMDQERMEMFMGLMPPPQWVGVKDDPAALDTARELERNGYLKTGWHHGSVVYKLTAKGVESAQRIMANPSLSALDESVLADESDTRLRCAWRVLHGAARATG
jgi:hypothetical protein